VNYDNYQNKLPYPNKRDFSTRFFYSKGRVVGFASSTDKAQLAALFMEFPLAVTEDVEDEPGFEQCKQAYKAEDTRIENQFIADLFEDFMLPYDDFSAALYSRAYDRGHSGRYSEVYSAFSDLVQLYEIAKQTFSAK
jgi:hypothetical protein